jgi:membrane-associated phospholipid phosphatase
VPVTLAVVLSAFVVAGIVWALSRSPAVPDPVDPEPEERWLVRLVGRHPGLGETARAIDRRVMGGLMLAVALSIVFGTALGVGVVFDMVDQDAGLARWDSAVADWGSHHASSWSTDVLDTLTNLGGTRYLVVIAAVIAVYDFARRRNGNVVLFLFVVLVGVVTINNGVKWLVDRERPPVPHLVGTSGSSFPSGHSAAAAAAWFAFALVLSRHWPRRARAVAAAVAAIVTIAVATSRALLGVHWLTDVVAGVLLGWGWFLLVALVFGGRLQRVGEPAERAARQSEEAVSPATTTALSQRRR